MSCGPTTTIFRLLDAYVGWDESAPDGAKNLRGLDDPLGVELDFTGGGSLQFEHLRPYLLPPSLARGCGCSWYLATQSSPPALLHRDPCTDEDACWTRVPDRTACRREPNATDLPAPEGHAVWVAAGSGRIVVADSDGGTIVGYTESSWRTTLSLAMPHPGPIALASNGELLVAADGTPGISRFTPSGDLIRLWHTPGRVLRIVTAGCVVWIVVSIAHELRLYRARRPGARFTPGTPAQFTADVGPSPVVWSDAGFCIDERGADGFVQRRCYDWNGCPLDGNSVHLPPGAARERTGQLLTGPLDSGIPRAQWHRIRIDADVPFGTSLSTSVASIDDANAAAQGVPDAGWLDFPAGVPHPSDWQSSQRALDYLVAQPPGRFLFLRLRLTGDGIATPTVRRIRIDVPRSTSADFLPDVFRATPDAEDFLERFISLFDAAIGELDDAIAAYPALLAADSVPEEVVPWLGGFLDLAFEPGWDVRRRRAILKAAPRLYRRRGTVSGLKEAIRLAADTDVALTELPLGRSWGAVGSGTVSGIRLFGRAKARMRLGASALGGAPLVSYGNPDHDPIAMLAHRFSVQVPHATDVNARERIDRLVQNLKPAHTLGDVRFAGDGFVVGTSSSIGVDTTFRPLPAPRLGRSGNVRLRRQSVLWRSARRGGGVTVGINSVVGTNMRAE